MPNEMVQIGHPCYELLNIGLQDECDNLIILSLIWIWHVNQIKELFFFFTACYSPLAFVSVISRWKSRLDI